MGDLFEGLNLRTSTSISPSSSRTCPNVEEDAATTTIIGSSNNVPPTTTGTAGSTGKDSSEVEVADATTSISLSSKENGELINDANVITKVEYEGEETGKVEGEGYRPLVICGPSGAGKGTMINLLMKYFINEQFGFSVSHTTRNPREGEIDGIHYNFTTVNNMKQLISDGKFIEHAEVHGKYYGTSFAAVESVQSSNKVCILDIDMQGVKNVKQSTLQPYYVFIAPPSIDILEKRLRGRGTESERDIEIRLKNASDEMNFGQTPNTFDLYLTNDNLEHSFQILVTKIKELYPHLIVAEEQERPVPAAISQEEEEHVEERENGEPKTNSNIDVVSEETVLQQQSSSSSVLLPPPLVFCGPSGAGKGTMINLLMERFNHTSSDKEQQQLGFCVSHTTRSPRDGEENGIHYHFTTVDKFQSSIKQNEFIEYAEVHGRYYGTSFAAMKSVQHEGKVCILDIDVQGVQNVKKASPSINANYVFISPPSMDVLEKRLRGRGTEKEEDVLKRLKNAKDEMLYGNTNQNEFNLFLINDNLQISFDTLVTKVKELYPHLIDLKKEETSEAAEGIDTVTNNDGAPTEQEEQPTAAEVSTSQPTDSIGDSSNSSSNSKNKEEEKRVIPPPPPPRSSPSQKGPDTKPSAIGTPANSTPLMETASSGVGTAPSNSSPTPSTPVPHLSPNKLVTPAKISQPPATTPALVVTIPPIDVLSSCLRILEKFVSRTKPKMPYDIPKKPKKPRGGGGQQNTTTTTTDVDVIPPSRVLTKLTGMNWLGTFVGATHYGFNYNSPYVGECVGCMNQLLDIIDNATKEQNKISKLEKSRPYQITRQESTNDIMKRRTEWVNKLVSTYVHLVCVWCSYSNVQANHAAAVAAATSNGGGDAIAGNNGQNTDPPVSSQLLCWAVDTAEIMVAHGCFDASVASVAAANSGNNSTAMVKANSTSLNASVMDPLSPSGSTTTTSSSSYVDVPHVSPIQQLSDSICRMDITNDESELSVLKFILTTGSRSCITPVGELSMLHGKDLLQLIRTTYHIYLKTSSEPNKTTARAALQQLVASVFQRMDIQDPLGIASTGARSISSTGIRSSPVAAASVLSSSSGAISTAAATTTTAVTASTGAAATTATLSPTAAASAFHNEGPFDSPHGMLSRPQLSDTNGGITMTPGSPAKREALEQFFQDHPDVAAVQTTPAPLPSLAPTAVTTTMVALPQSDAWYPSIVSSLGFPSITTTALATEKTTKQKVLEQRTTATSNAAAITPTPKRSHTKKTTLSPSSEDGMTSTGTGVVVKSTASGVVGQVNATTTTTTTTTSFASPSHLDAFLVLRSLCKLSMKSLPDDMLMSSPSSSSGVESYYHDDMSSATGGTNTNPAMESKILALELLLYVLDHATPSASLFSTPSFSFAIRNYLCVSLLKNCTSNNTRIVALSLRLFIPIIRHFREGLKTEIEAFVTNVFFVILDSPNSTVEHKSLVVTLFQEICSCEDTLAEIFLNYDCDLSAVDLFHRIVTTLSKVASKKGGELDFSDRGVFSVGGSNIQNIQLRQSHRELKLSAMRALREVLSSLYESLKVERENTNNILNNVGGSSNSMRVDSNISGDGSMSVNSGNPSLSSTGGGGGGGGNNDASSTAAMSDGGTTNSTMMMTATPTPNKAPSSMNGISSSTTKVPSSAGSNIVKMYDSKKKRREQEIEIYLRFNKKPAAGIKYAGECGFFNSDSPIEVAKFLLKCKDKVDKTQIGDYLGREPDYQNGFAVRVLHSYVDMLDFSDMSFDDAIRYFLSGFRLPGEAQKIDRIMEKFAERFCKQNPTIFPTADTAFILGFSVIMLNTDLHNPAIKEERRMTKDGFRRNNRGICDGQDLPDEFLNGIFDRIKEQPISLKEDDDARRKVGQGGGGGGSGGGGGGDGSDGSTRQTNATNFLFGHNVHETEEQNRYRETKFLQERDQIVRSTEMIFQQQHRRNKGGGGGGSGGGTGTTGGGSGTTGTNRNNSTSGDASSKGDNKRSTNKLSSSTTSTASVRGGGGGGGGLLQSLPVQASKFVRTTDALKDEYVVPMFDVTWGPALAVFSTAVEGTSDIEKLVPYASDHELDMIYENAADILDVALNGFRLAICTAGLCGNDTARSAFVQALYNFSRLGTHRLLSTRHVRCAQALLHLANDDGELLGNTWEHIFKSLSEVNRLLHVHDELIRQERGQTRRGGRHGGPHGHHNHHHHDDASLSSQDSYGSMNTDGELALHEDDMDHRAIDEENAIMIYEAIPEGIVDKIYHRSALLSNYAVKEFIFQLCRVSRMEIAGYGGHVGSRANAIVMEDELDAATAVGAAATTAGNPSETTSPAGGQGQPQRKHQPIIYSLQQIVQVTHYNMESRSRLVFAELWSTVAAHLTSTALHTNPAVTMYAVDSLRQLGLQFLQRDELGMFEFQRKFLKPYEYVMERSRETSTKELLLASVQQMIVMFGDTTDSSTSSGSGGGKLRSGWKSVLIVLGFASNDTDDRIATMGYEILRDLATQTLLINNSSSTTTTTDNTNSNKSSPSSLLLKEHFVDLSDSLFMYVSGSRIEMSLDAIDILINMSTWLADDLTPLPLMRKATTSLEQQQQTQQQDNISSNTTNINGTSTSSSEQDLELWWPILLGLSRNVGHADLMVRDKSLKTLITLIENNFFPSKKSTSTKNKNDDEEKDSLPSITATTTSSNTSHISLQTLRMIFKGVLLPTLEHAETDVPSLLYASPKDVPNDFHRFATTKASSKVASATGSNSSSTSSSASATASSPSAVAAAAASGQKDSKNNTGGGGGFLGLGRKSSRNLGRKDSNKNSSSRLSSNVDESSASASAQQQQEQQQLQMQLQQEQTCWINTTLDPFLDACVNIGLRSMDAFVDNNEQSSEEGDDSDDNIIEDVLSLLNACLVSDSSSVVIKGLYHLYNFLMVGLAEVVDGSNTNIISTDNNTWATVCHMLRRTIRGQQQYDYVGVTPGSAEYIMLTRRMYIPSHVINIVGLLLLQNNNNGNDRMGLQWYLFLANGLAQGIEQWEKSAPMEGKMLAARSSSAGTASVPPTHLENAIYGRTLLVKLMLQLASNKDMVASSSSKEGENDETTITEICDFLKDETQKLLTTFGLKEKALLGGGSGQSTTVVLALKKQKQDPIKVMELEYLSQIIKTLLDGYYNNSSTLDNDDNDSMLKFHSSWLYPILLDSKNIKINNDTVQKSIRSLESRLSELKTPSKSMKE